MKSDLTIFGSAHKKNQLQTVKISAIVLEYLAISKNKLKCAARTRLFIYSNQMPLEVILFSTSFLNILICMQTEIISKLHMYVRTQIDAILHINNCTAIEVAQINSRFYASK